MATWYYILKVYATDGTRAERDNITLRKISQLNMMPLLSKDLQRLKEVIFTHVTGVNVLNTRFLSDIQEQICHRMRHFQDSDKNGSLQELASKYHPRYVL